MGGSGKQRWSRALGAALACLLLWAAPAAADQPAPGKTVTGEVTSGGSEFSYRLYVPASYSRKRPAPLLVMAHGCQTTAEQEQDITRYDELAERKRFLVLYPDVDEVGRNLPGPLRQCWKFWEPTTLIRGLGDPAAIVKMTRRVMADRTVDPERVYIAGISAGGLMASVLAATYADLYAASAVMSSAGFGDFPCFATGIGQPAATSAMLAHQAMGSNERVVPTIALGGDADAAFAWSCTAKALEQSLRTNNLVLSGNQGRPLSFKPAGVDKRRKPGGHEYTVRTYRDAAGCIVGESWQVHGMGHFWSGGTTDPDYSGYADRKGPSGARATWAFFERFRKSETGMPCAEAREPPCPRRKVSVKLKRGTRARAVRAKVNGKRVRAQLRGRRVVVSIPPGADERVRLRIRVRRAGDRGKLVLRRKVQRCARG